MRIAVVYSQSPKWPKMLWVCDALRRLGHDVVPIHGRTGLAEADETSELVIFQHKGVVRWPNLQDIAARKRAVWVQWWFDLIQLNDGPLDDLPYVRTHGEIMGAMDMLFCKERALTESPWRLQDRTWYLDQGCPSDWPAANPIPDKLRRDVVLWGQENNQYRDRNRDAFALVEAGLRIRWLPWTHPSELSAAASCAPLILHASRRNDIDSYTSDGYWLACGTGRMVLKRAYPGMPEGPFLTYRDRDELVSKARMFLSLSRERQEQHGAALREWTLREHSIERRCEKLLTLVKFNGLRNVA